jgi:hypothetical protein
MQENMNYKLLKQQNESLKKPVKIEPVKIEPVKIEPVKIEPVKIEPVKKTKNNAKPLKDKKRKDNVNKIQIVDDTNTDLMIDLFS